MKDYPLPHPPTTKREKNFGSLPAPRYGHATTIMVIFLAHLHILEYSDHHKNLTSSSLYYPGPLHKISGQSVYNFLSNVVHRQTDRQNKQTNAQCCQKHNLLCQGGNKNIHYHISTSLAKKVMFSAGFVCLFVSKITKTNKWIVMGPGD